MNWIALTLVASLPLGKCTQWESVEEANLLFCLIPFCTVEIFTRCIYNIKTCIALYKRDSQWEFAVRLRELKLELGDNLEGWGGKGGGRGHR